MAGWKVPGYLEVLMGKSFKKSENPWIFGGFDNPWLAEKSENPWIFGGFDGKIVNGAFQLL